MNPLSLQPDLSQDERQLIAFHLGETLLPVEERTLRGRLEADPAFAALSEEVAHTLRVFSADPVPPPDTAAAWQRLRDTLPPLEPQPAKPWARFRSHGRGWLLPSAAVALALVLITVALAVVHVRHAAQPRTEGDGIVHLRPPRDTGNGTGEADHLDRAERWLTVVNHSSTPLDPDTRAQGQQILIENADYLQRARDRGDAADAAVLDHLGRVLTTSNHPAEAGLQLRLDMNTDGLLFQIRILRQNQTASHGDPR